MWIDMTDVAWAIATAGVFVLTAFTSGYVIGHFAGWCDGFNDEE